MRLGNLSLMQTNGPPNKPCGTSDFASASAPKMTAEVKSEDAALSWMLDSSIHWTVPWYESLTFSYHVSTIYGLYIHLADSLGNNTDAGIDRIPQFSPEHPRTILISQRQDFCFGRNQGPMNQHTGIIPCEHAWEAGEARVPASLRNDGMPCFSSSLR